MASTKDVLDHHLKCFDEVTSRASYLIMRRVPSCSRQMDRCKPLKNRSQEKRY